MKPREICWRSRQSTSNYSVKSSSQLCKVCHIELELWIAISHLTFQLCTGDEGVYDPGEDRNNSELLSLLKQESGENPVFEGYRVSFEDQYGDQHDWQSGVTTQLYLCRQLYVHYNSQVYPVRGYEIILFSDAVVFCTCAGK